MVIPAARATGATFEELLKKALQDGKENDGQDFANDQANDDFDDDDN